MCPQRQCLRPYLHTFANFYILHETDVNSELQCYTAELQDRAPLQAQSAIQFWLDRESSYKRLSQLALVLVASPAAQAYVERLFSVHDSKKTEQY